MNILKQLSLSANHGTTVLSDKIHSLNFIELKHQVELRVTFLKTQNVKVLGLFLDNGIDWVLFDLAAQQLEIICIPIPLFFSHDQIDHAIKSASIDCVISNIQGLVFEQSCTSKTFNSQFAINDNISQKNILYSYQLHINNIAKYPKNTQKVTFTSGSTGDPKGVCLSRNNQLNVATSLMQVIDIKAPKHLCLLPLSILLENIAGIYAPLLAGGSVIVLPQSEYGFSGSQLVDTSVLLTAITAHQPNSLILVPELLLVLVMACKSGWQVPASLKFIAVGGAHVASELLIQASEIGLPVYQGYGLSECGSVVSLNTPNNNHINSAGAVLPHLSAEVIEGELIVSGELYLGYLNKPDSWYQNTYFTGDLVNLTGNHLTIKGRKKNVLISSFGRNINPEWPESLLFSSGIFKQCIVIGDQKPYCIALLLPMEQASNKQISAAISVINLKLPDYAKIKNWIILDKPMTASSGLLTSNNRPKRDAIHTHYLTEIETLYLNDSTHLKTLLNETA